MYILLGRIINAVSDAPIERGLVAVEGDKIIYAGEQDGFAVPENATFYTMDGATILPGFIDAHAHLTGSESVNRTGETPFDLLLTVVSDLGELVDAGITGVRDMSLFGPHLKRAVEKGLINGPRIMPGGRVMSISSGHVDLTPDLSVEESNARSVIGYLADGTEGCLRGVRQMFREGAEFIKICATGGVSSAVDKIDDVQFSDAELKVIVEEAARHGTYVAAHCTGTAGTLQALKAGVQCIEHGVMLDEECIQLMIAADASLVTTLSITLGISEFSNLPEYMVKKAQNLKSHCLRSYQMAHDAGVRVALGTDYSNSPNTPFREIGKEFYSLTRCGYSPMEAIKAGTINGAYLMKNDRQTGSLETGKLADLVLVAGNPLDDIRLLGNSDNIRLVMIGGKIRKDTMHR